MNGLLDFIKTPEGQGLLSTVFGGLAGAQRGAPLNSLGRAGMAGVMGYGNALGRQAQLGQIEQVNKLRNMQMSEVEAQSKLREVQAKQLEAAQAMQARKDAAMANPWMTPEPTQGTINVPEVGGVEMFSKAKVGNPSYQGKPVLNVPNLLANRVSPAEIEAISKLDNLGLQKVARTIKGTGPDGKEYEYQVDEFARKIGDGFMQWKAPILSEGGGQTNVLDPYNPLKPLGSIPKTMTFADKTSAAQLDIARERLIFDQGGGTEGGVSQAGLNKQFGKPQAGYRWKADGSMEFIPGGPADQKAQSVKTGEGTVQGVVADLRDKYTILDKENGIVSTNNRMGTNVGAWIGSTGVGQTANGMFGTKTQSARDSIAMTRPLLLQSIMKATGMSAKQMDSNAELKLYLATATDPTKGLEANLEALDRIESLYGGGNERFKATTPQATTNNGWSMEKVR